MEHGISTNNHLVCIPKSTVNEKKRCNPFSQLGWLNSSLLFLITLISVFLRVGLVLVNRQANDDHIEVVNLILMSGSLPKLEDCWECFQPKLYHFTVAEAASIVPGIQRDVIIQIGQWINFSAGIITLFLIGLLIIRIPTKNQFIKIMAFGMVALNPKLIGINSQATNDSFAIFFSTAALFFTYHFIQKRRLSSFLFILLFTVLGISSKTNTWVTAMAIPLAFCARAWVDRKQAKIWLLAGIILILSTFLISVINPLNQYIANFHKYASPVAISVPKQPFPQIFNKTVAANPGILSVSDGLFTFRYIDLLSRPVIVAGHEYTADRTSLWTQLYGRAHSVHFDNWPSSWATDGSSYFNLSRMIYVLALPLTFLLLFGFLVEVVTFVRYFFKRDTEHVSNLYYGLNFGIFTGYFLAIILYVLLYRDYTFMKVIFIYPAVATYPILFTRGARYFEVRFEDRFSKFSFFLRGWAVSLLLFYVLDVASMILLISSRMGV